ncbi:hypothetical protein HPB48_019308 [Haemaphysalis longicornis]|uniref:Retrotransposon gag domain-containing protein n=1 Tax=Haemaphysalis longicornis TaxID=44386 RepID=A0A9J6FP36_HAELO|nr:hypothetical protein HPB48_019308 [Haemaphysalis longicornis]
MEGFLNSNLTKGISTVYLERFEVFAAANDFAPGKKLQVFLASIGEKAYLTLRNLLLPKTPAETTFEEVVTALKGHYTPGRQRVTERSHFYLRQQQPQETVADFIEALKKLAAKCGFGAFLQEALRDRLIAGLRDDTIRCRLHDDAGLGLLGLRMQRSHGHGSR